MRSLTVFIGVAGCSALICIAFLMKAYMLELEDWSYRKINRYESKIELDKASDEEVSDIIERYNGEPMRETAVRLHLPEEKINCALTVYDDNMQLIKPTDPERRNIDIPESGLAISSAYAEKYKLKQGDKLSFSFITAPEVYEDEITAIYRDPNSKGVIMSKSAYEAHGLKFKPTAVISAQKVDDTEIQGAASIISKDKAIQDWQTLSDSMNAMVYILITASIILSTVVSYNLGLLSFSEKRREFATLRVLGFSQNKIRKIMLSQNLFLSISAFIIGVPVAAVLMQKEAAEMNSIDFILVLRGRDLLLNFLITAGLAVLVSLIFAKKIRQINMAEALKSSE